jgi:hypothetical protein
VNPLQSLRGHAGHIPQGRLVHRHARALHETPYDGHTLSAVIAHLEELTRGQNHLSFPKIRFRESHHAPAIFVIDFFKSSRRLEAENLFLRQSIG